MDVECVHVLLEDVPGSGKTMLARSMAASLGIGFKRIQCTPDLLPNDVTGVSIFNQQSGEFEFREGPIFVNILLADEINRATPRTQSALLEAMQEQQVTVDGVTRDLPRPFLVLATQNPVEYEGTFPLPEAQLDRFLMRLLETLARVDVVQDSPLVQLIQQVRYPLAWGTTLIVITGQAGDDVLNELHQERREGQNAILILAGRDSPDDAIRLRGKSLGIAVYFIATERDLQIWMQGSKRT